MNSISNNNNQNNQSNNNNNNVEDNQQFTFTSQDEIVQFYKFDPDTELFLVSIQSTNKIIEHELINQQWMIQKEIEKLFPSEQLLNIDFSNLKLQLPKPTLPKSNSGKKLGRSSRSNSFIISNQDNIQ